MPANDAPIIVPATPQISEASACLMSASKPVPVAD